jgi:hypothetical protein
LFAAALLPRTHGKASGVWIDLADAVGGFRTPDETPGVDWSARSLMGLDDG